MTSIRTSVIVGNIGTIDEYPSKNQGLKVYKEYVEASKMPFGRASGESVSLIDVETGEPIKEHFGTIDED